MLVQVKQLLYWKTEHGNASNCQDAPSYDPGHGLFAVADGAGTSLFPAIWARILAQHFVTIPLMSADPFEIEWWVRIAQNEYKQHMPAIDKSAAWNIKEKMRNQCSDSTLATIRITKVDKATAQAMLLVFGDSCILIGDPGKQTVSSFILQNPGEFDRAPLCIPSDLKYFNRDFHRCQTKSVTLTTSDQVIIATDAVARWILGHGEMPDIWDAFQQVYQCSIDDWCMFVKSKRQSKEMVDDDSTALVLTFYELQYPPTDRENEENQIGHSTSPNVLQYPLTDRRNEEKPTPLPASPNAGDSNIPIPNKSIGFALGSVNRHTAEVIAERKAAFEEAAKSDDKRLLAITYGDGNDFASITTTPPLNTINIAHAREVANALKEVLAAFSEAQNSPSLVQKVKPVWDKYSHLLQDETCAAHLRETLRKNKIIHSTSSTITDPPTQVIPEPSLEDTQVVNKPKKPPKFEDVPQPSTAIEIFNDLLQRGTNPVTLLNAYREAQQTNPSLPLPEPTQALLRLAQEFVTAWNTNDPYLLTKAYRNINISRFNTKIIFTREEAERWVQASNFVQKQKEEMRHIIIARVDDCIIPLKHYIETYIIKRMYLRYLLSQPPGSPAARMEQVYVADSLNHNDFPLLVLEELMDSILIDRGIEVIPLGDPFHRELETEMTQLANELKQYQDRQPDPDFTRRELNAQDLKTFARMITAQKLFATYLSNRQSRLARLKKVTLDDWLREKKQKEKDTIFFHETERYAYTNRMQILNELKQYLKTYIY